MKVSQRSSPSESQSGSTDDQSHAPLSFLSWRKKISSPNGGIYVMTIQEIMERCQGLFEDLHFNVVKQWKAAVPGRKAIGYMPVYVPREIVHAAGMLPEGIFGGGDQLEVIQGDAYYQSYICRIPRSTLEMGLTGRLDWMDGMLFPSICD